MSKLLFIPLPASWKLIVQRALLCAVALERLALAEVRAGFEHSPDPRSRLVSEVDRLREALALKDEECRILRARLEPLPPQRRPHYPPRERLAILLLRAKCGWNQTETARRFLVAPATISEWMKRLDEDGATALVRTPVPVNRFDDVVALLVQQLRQVTPGFGRRKLAEVLARSGVVLAASTVKRLLERKVASPPLPGAFGAGGTKSTLEPEKPKRVVTARYARHAWHCDISSNPIGSPDSGCWVPWWPFALALRWVLSFHFAVVVDHFSRALVAFGVYRQEPTGRQICALLDNAVRTAGRAPRHLVTDKGTQFGAEYRAWCVSNGVKPRFGAVGQHGSIAVVERFILSIKQEFLWKLFVPYRLRAIEQLFASYQNWYNNARPHSVLDGRTPAEVRDGVKARPVKLETRARMPLARAKARARGHPRVKRCGKLVLQVSHVDGHPLLPVIELREAAQRSKPESEAEGTSAKVHLGTENRPRGAL